MAGDESGGDGRAVAKHCQPGTRFASHRVVGQADPRAWELHHHMPSDGRFRIVVFGGDVSQAGQRALVNEFGAWARGQLQPRFGIVAAAVGAEGEAEAEAAASVIDVLLVHAAPRESVELLTDLDAAYHPWDGRRGWDYSKAFVDEHSYHEGHGRAYHGYGVDAAGRGAAVVVRPDLCTGLVASLDAAGRDRIQAWFDAVLRRRVDGERE